MLDFDIVIVALVWSLSYYRVVENEEVRVPLLFSLGRCPTEEIERERERGRERE